MDEPLKGKLLVAAPLLTDPNFHRTVVLVLEHNEQDGALGLVLDRPSQTPVADALPGWESLTAPPAVVFVGGPVASGAVVCLGRRALEPPQAGWAPLFGPLGTVDLSLDPDDLSDGLDRVRIFSGYSGWGVGQLESEIEEGAWFVVDGDTEDALSASPTDLWRFVLRRQRGPLALVATYPPDPSTN